ncbi:hypothetical protein E9993_10765 [Labilibacter sediminis]|nr:hypothetical protein E9993_10765 [Labilibacter sediminis]
MKIRFCASGHNILLWVALIMSSPAMAQNACKSNLGSHFKSNGDTRFSWAAELMVGQGVMTERTFSNTMVNAGFNFSTEDFKHQFYLEGTLKYWWNTKPGAVGGKSGSGEHYSSFSSPAKKHLGFRELFYQYKRENTFFKLGIQTYVSPDYFLVDERLIGASYQHKFGAFTFNAMLATSHRNIARMQNVCGTRHVYQLLRGGRVDFIGDRLLESNLYLMSMNYKPGNKAPVNMSSKDDDEFSEFESFDEFSDGISKKESVLKEIGLAYYQEFGDIFHQSKYYGAMYSTLNLPLDISLKLEGVYQYISTENVGLIYSGLSRYFKLDKSNLKLEGGYFYKTRSDVPFYPTFSNMFIGEVIRMDSREMPLTYADVIFGLQNKLKTYLRLGGAYQVNGNNSNEIDLEIGSRVWKKMRAFTTFSRIESDVLYDTYYMGKLEIRITL